jgi:hypothetical protein
VLALLVGGVLHLLRLPCWTREGPCDVNWRLSPKFCVRDPHGFLGRHVADVTLITMMARGWHEVLRVYALEGLVVVLCDRRFSKGEEG